MIDSLLRPAPATATHRTLLLALRRIAVGGTQDAQAVNILLGHFGIGYRRLHMFYSVLIVEIARISQQTITIAPFCCSRMTEGEAAILEFITVSREDPREARRTLARVTDTLDNLAALSVAQALADALDDVGRPISP